MDPNDNNPAPAPENPTPAPAPAPEPAQNNPEPAPAPAPQDPNANPQPQPEPTNPNDPHIKPGQAPSDLDMDALLEELENEVEDEKNPKPVDPNAPQDPNAQPQNPESPKPEEPAKQPEQPSGDPFEQVDYKDPANVFAPAEDPDYNIAPIGEIRNPEPNETAQDYFQKVTAPAVMKLVQNMTGIAARNADRQGMQQQQEIESVRNGWVQEIDELVKGNHMPAYTVDSTGAMDINSEGGKVVGAVLKFIEEFNARPNVKGNPNRQIKSFEQGFNAYQRVEAARQKQEAAQASGQRRRSAAAIIGGGGNGNGAPKARKQNIRKGQSVTDLDFENLLS